MYMSRSPSLFSISSPKESIVFLLAFPCYLGNVLMLGKPLIPWVTCSGNRTLLSLAYSPSNAFPVPVHPLADMERSY